MAYKQHGGGSRAAYRYRYSVHTKIVYDLRMFIRVVYVAGKDARIRENMY